MFRDSYVIYIWVMNILCTFHASVYLAMLHTVKEFQVLLFTTTNSIQTYSLVLWPRKASLMKTQTRILDNRLYYTRTIELQRKGKKSRIVRITPILICSIWWPPHPTGMCGTRSFLGGSGRRAVAHTRPAFLKMPTAPSAFPLLGVPRRG